MSSCSVAGALWPQGCENHLNDCSDNNGGEGWQERCMTCRDVRVCNIGIISYVAVQLWCQNPSQCCLCKDIHSALGYLTLACFRHIPPMACVYATPNKKWKWHGNQCTWNRHCTWKTTCSKVIDYGHVCSLQGTRLSGKDENAERHAPVFPRELHVMYLMFEGLIHSARRPSPVWSERKGWARHQPANCKCRTALD